MTANGLVSTKTTRATAPAAASRPATISAFRPSEAVGSRYSAATASGSASSTALNFDPTASPAITPAKSHVTQPPRRCPTCSQRHRRRHAEGQDRVHRHEMAELDGQDGEGVDRRSEEAGYVERGA